ncbi:MAG: thioesterase family protein [Bradymonadia bacterium]
MSNSLAHLLGHEITRGKPLSLPRDYCLEAGIFGGLLLGVAADAVINESTTPLRVLHLNLCALALPEMPLYVETTSLRKGRHTESLSLKLTQAGTVVAHGSAFCGDQRQTQPDELSLSMPQFPTLESVSPVPEKAGLPPYTKHIELRPCWGESLFSNGPMRSGGWVRLRTPSPGFDEVIASTLIDSWWPANLSRGLRPMATVSIQIAFANIASAKPNEHCALTVQTTTVNHGYATELDQLWSADGQLIASAQQVIAIIK